MPRALLPWLRLLSVLLTVAGCDASQQQLDQPNHHYQQQQPEPSREWFETLLSQVVTTATEPLLRPLADKMERFHSQLDVLVTRLDNQDHKLEGLAARLDNQDHKLERLPTLLTTRLDNQDHKLEGLPTLLAVRLDGLAIRLENRNSELDNHSSKLKGVMARLDNQDFKMDGLSTKLSRQESTLDEIRKGFSTNLSCQDTKLNEIITTLSNQKADLDGLVSGLSSHDTELSGIVTTLSNQETDLNGLVPGLSSQDTKLSGIVTTLSNQKTDLNRLVYGLSSQNTKLTALTSSLSAQTSILSGLVTQIDQVSTNITNITRSPLPRDCSDLPAGAASGIHLLQLGLGQPPVPAFCNMDKAGGGWTVIQRRADIQPRQNFFLDWEEYRKGFGELESEFWWGLDHLWMATSARDRQYELRIDLEDFDDEKRYAVYHTFRVSSECDGYRLLAENYTGNAGDNMGYHSGQKFTTKDKDQDRGSAENCAETRQGGWWYNFCTETNLNGPYLSGESPGEDGISWYAWRGRHYSLKAVEMKIRPS